MTKAKFYFLLPALPIAAFLVGTIFLQTNKAPWVDECYTYYGITHDSWDGFFDSICSGVNFSPPLYFLLNWIVQLVFHIPIGALRIESALWISLGMFLIFIRCAKSFGGLSAFLGCTVVLLQSKLLFEQALEARHYGMFFATGAWLILLFPENQRFNSKKHNALYFLAHLTLSLTHYLGIVFSALTGIARFWFQRKKGVKESLPITEITSSLVALPVYIVLLSQQSSHLGNWVKPNTLTSLLETSFNSLTLLTLVIPILLSLFFIKSRIKPNATVSLSPIVIIAIIWFLTPIIFWIISHVSSLNLFKDRYFIPKEAAVMVLVSYFLHRVIPMLGKSKSPLSSKLLSVGVTLLVCISMFLLSAKRTLFGFEPNKDYHHKLLIKEEVCRSPLTKIYSGDHLFFPNYYTNTSYTNHTLVVSNERIKEVYNRFNSIIDTITLNEFSKEPFVLILDVNNYFINDISIKRNYFMEDLILPLSNPIKAYRMTPVKDVP
jgi:hypothetical protein